MFSNGVLSINKEEAMAFIKEDEHITELDIVIAKPGENTRIVPVKEAAEPRFVQMIDQYFLELQETLNLQVVEEYMH